jgi:hypothetical protein
MRLAVVLVAALQQTAARSSRSLRLQHSTSTSSSLLDDIDGIDTKSRTRTIDLTSALKTGAVFPSELMFGVTPTAMRHDSFAGLHPDAKDGRGQDIDPDQGTG